MTAIGIALLVFACTFLGALLGMRMRSALPEQHLSDASKDVIHLCMGLIATMTALILGLVTASAKSTFDEQDTAVRTAAASVLTLDRTLARFGPETKPMREDLRRALTTAVDRIWAERAGTRAAGERRRPNDRGREDRAGHPRSLAAERRAALAAIPGARPRERRAEGALAVVRRSRQRRPDGVPRRDRLLAHGRCSGASVCSRRATAW